MVKELIEQLEKDGHSNRILTVLEVDSPSSNKDSSVLTELVLPYSVLPDIDLEKLKQNFSEDISNNKHVIIVMQDFDIEKVEDKIKLKKSVYDSLIKLIKEKNLKYWVHILLISDINQISMDSKFEFFDLFSKFNPTIDKGFHEMIRLTVIHKNLVLGTFSKYVVAYVLAGSQIKGRAGESSDIDVYVVIDDTDVKLHTFVELKQKLYSIITKQALEAMAIVGTKKVLHPQVYTLTEFWLAMSESNPVIVTFLRDGLALYDRGMFIAWKQMLLKGILKPSKEAAEVYLSASNNKIREIEDKLRLILMEDIALSMLTAAQAVLMDYGLLPPDPKEAPGFLKRIFVEEKKILEDEYYKMLEEIIKIRKDIEHRKKEVVTGEEIQEWLEKAKKFLKRMESLKTFVDSEKEKEEIEELIKQLYQYFVEIEYLFGKSIEEVISEKFPSEKEWFKGLIEEVNKFRSGMTDIVNIKELSNNLKRAIRFLRNISDEYKMNIINKNKIQVISNGKTYDVYISKDYIYIVGEEIEKYNRLGDLVDKIPKTELESLISNDLSRNAINRIDNKVIEVLKKRFGNFEIVFS